MQIIIPMAGTGERFMDFGYKVVKPLIEIAGKPMIEHVVELFPGESNFTFICNSVHLKETDMRAVIKRICPQGKIVEIPPHKKGPVYSVFCMMDSVDDDDEVIVNYCDFSKTWDYADFLETVRTNGASGAICAYRGFHPHMLGSTNYAFIRDENRWMMEIQEKKPFTSNRMDEFASDGTYYFKNGKLLKQYFKALIAQDINVKGEYYVSMVYNLLKASAHSIYIYEIKHMLQWGTPEDLLEFTRWLNYFGNLQCPCAAIEPVGESINLIPLAGKGIRFVNEGYRDPKPLIDIEGTPMVIAAAMSLPPAEKYIFVCLAGHLSNFPLAETIEKYYPGAKVVSVDKVTEGQACTCEIGLSGEPLQLPLLVGACDNGMLWDSEKYKKLIDDPTVDAIVWSFRHHPSSKRNPHMYSWIVADNDGNVLEVSEKRAISNDPFNDHAVVGTFYFRKAAYFLDSLVSLYKGNKRVNNEFYVDSCINELLAKGLKVKVFEVSDYICWGTPDDLKTFLYWYDFFVKTGFHSVKHALIPSCSRK
ncbi:MAG: NTP transferase domain-containing protein [Nitrospirae bacterium YQR-1]